MYSKERTKAIVIGGGHNGLCCAFYLAQAGIKVKVFERRGVVGGAAVTEEFHPGFRNSVASYTVSLLNPKVIKEMRLHELGLKVLKRPISNFLPTDDGRYIKLGGSLQETQTEFSKFSTADAAALPEYYRRLEAVADVLRDFSEKTPPNSGGGMKTLLSSALQFWPLARADTQLHEDLLALFTKSASSFLDYWFESPYVKAAFAFDSVVGNFASPDTPGSAYVLLHHVFGEVNGEKGAWGHAVGGMGSITQAMQKACLELGVVIQTNASVKRVITEGERVQGVELENGSVELAPIVVSNVNPKLLYTQLMDNSQLDADFRRRIENYRCGSGTFRMNVALSELPDFEALPGKQCAIHHQSGIVIAPTIAYMDQAYLDAKQYGWSRKPIVEMLIPSTLDDTLAPKGKHVASLFCQQFKPHLDDQRSWDEEREAAAQSIVDVVTEYAPNFRSSILAMMILSPEDLERKFGLIDGDIMHGNMNLDQLWSARPLLGYGNYCGPVEGLYMCGAGSHPGGGVTGLPGKNAAREILKNN